VVRLPVETDSWGFSYFCLEFFVGSSVVYTIFCLCVPVCNWLNSSQNVGSYE